MQDFLDTNHIELLSADGKLLTLHDLATWRAVMTGESINQMQEVVRRSDGTTIPILVSAIPLTDLCTLHPSISGPLIDIPNSDDNMWDQVALVVHQDVSTLKEAEALKDEFINLATHELRTPVTILAMGTDMLVSRSERGKGQKLDERQEKILRDMRQATHQLSKITEDLVDVTRLQSGHLKIEPTTTDLIALTRNIIDQLQLTTQLHQIKLHTPLNELSVFVDAARIEQVITNLLSNAIKYSPQGGPIDVTITENLATHEALFKVQDQGLGIPAEQQSRIFGRFMRADNVKAMHIGGTGLGLYLCRELIKCHSGSIWFESKEGVGSTFFFTLPLCTPQPEHPTHA
ncbi:sensor histidine kinase [Dictyobacter kobayashii]|uniref:histidine kinase n=1 Tax=Dictyobacter kobayashii TaxID=2014872 RepID=A0A402ARS1_9CHLR|nr:HAMP domain-containing sensor histidine kinase [Dictyobacter kobayashii]GCE21787.1 hypothetical protein KDK_55870 [Dictyobacter kobayashii]